MRPRLLYLMERGTPGIGGPERLNKELSIRLTADFEVQILTSPRDSHFSKALFNWRLIYRVLRGRVRADLIFSGSRSVGAVAVFAGKLLGIPVVSLVQDAPPENPTMWERKITFPLLRRADGLLVATQSWVEPWKRYAPGEKVKRFLPGIEVNEWRAETRWELRESLGKSIGVPLGRGPLLASIGSAANLDHLKDFISYVFPGLLRQFPDLCFLIVSEAGARKAICSEKGTSDFEKNIRFVELSEESLNAVLGAANALLFPPNSLAALEANARGLPVVGWQGSEAGLIVEEGVNGVLVPVGEPDALFGKIVFLLNRYRERDWAPECRKLMMEKFSWDSLLPKFTDYLQAQMNTRFRASGLLGLGARLKS